MISSSTAAIRKSLTALQVSPTLLPISERIQLLRQSSFPLAPTHTQAIYHSLLQVPSLSLDTSIFNSMMRHSLLYNKSLLERVGEDERNREVLDSIMNLLSDMSHLDLKHDGKTYSLLIQAHMDLSSNTSNKEECMALFREAAATNLPLESDTYAAIIDLLIAKSVETDVPIGKSSIWEIYSAVKKASVRPSFALFTSLIQAFTHLNAGSQVAKIYATLHRLGGAHPDIYKSSRWPEPLYIAILNSLAKTRVPIPGGDERVVNRLMYLIRKGELTMNVHIVNAMISYWNSKGKYAAAVRLAGREGFRGVDGDEGTLMGLIDAGIGMRDIEVLRERVLRVVYEGQGSVDVWASGVQGIVMCLLEPRIEVAMGKGIVGVETEEQLESREDVTQAVEEKATIGKSKDGDVSEFVEEITFDDQANADVVALPAFDRFDIMRLIEGLLGHHTGSNLYNPVHPVTDEFVKREGRVSERVAGNLAKSFAQLVGREQDGEMFGRVKAYGVREEVMRAFSTGWIEGGGDEEELLKILQE